MLLIDTSLKLFRFLLGTEDSFFGPELAAFDGTFLNNAGPQEGSVFLTHRGRFKRNVISLT